MSNGMWRSEWPTFGFPKPETLPGVAYLDDHGNPAAIFWHVCADNDPDHYPVPSRLPLYDNGWTLVQREPLTIKPSILCKACNLHGFFTNGEWRAA